MVPELYGYPRHVTVVSRCRLVEWIGSDTRAGDHHRLRFALSLERMRVPRGRLVESQHRNGCRGRVHGSTLSERIEISSPAQVVARLFLPNRWAAIIRSLVAGQA